MTNAPIGPVENRLPFVNFFEDSPAPIHVLPNTQSFLHHAVHNRSVHGPCNRSPKQNALMVQSSKLRVPQSAVREPKTRIPQRVRDTTQRIAPPSSGARN